ncbi:hypothetical protein ACKGJO_06795 [Gracilimonas sp. Q87]|uniref:hypothetical protein n=1 Tax=Gracilimonas sp. Q87 TaxID=3384766 RepID=UPI003983F9E9
MSSRKVKLLPQGKPKWIRCYDNGGKSFDRYTVVFTGRYRKSPYDDFIHLGLSKDPFHPQGFGQHGFSDEQIDRPKYAHLGSPIEFEDLPTKCQTAVINTYVDVWNLE